MKLGELWVALGFKSDISPLKEMKEGMLKAKDQALAFKLAIVGTVVAIEQMMAASIQSAMTLEEFSLQTGLSTQQLQRWSYIAEQSGLSGDSVIQAIKGIQQAQASIKLGGGNLRPFQLLGISPYEDPFKVLEELKSKIKGLDPAIATNIISELGVGQEFLNVLRGGGVEFTKLNKQFVLTHKETDNLTRLSRVWKDLWFSLKGVRDRLAAMNFKPFILFVQMVKNSISLFFELAMRFFDLYNSSQRLQGAIIILGAILLIAFAPVTAIILLILLILDDLWTGLHGGDSVTRDVLKWWDRFKVAHPIIADLIKVVGLFAASFLALEAAIVLAKIATTAYTVVLNAAKIAMFAFNLATKMTPFGWIITGLTAVSVAILLVTKHWKEIKELFSKGLDWAKVTTGEGVKKFKDIFKGFDFSEMFKDLGDTLVNALLPIMKLIMAVIGKALGLKNIGAEIAKIAGSLGLDTIFGSKDSDKKIVTPPLTGGGNNITNNQIVNVKVDGSQNPKEVGDAVVEASKKHFQKQINKSTYGTPVST